MTTEPKAVNEADCCDPEEGSRMAAAEGDGRLADAATLFKALSDKTRLRIVQTIARSQEAVCECEIVPMFGLSQSTISYHLKVLREAGIVECEKRGLWGYCRVNPRSLMNAVKTLAGLA
ncbi:MAG TPA: metalloregulator ArsR/SmtB family transcription factor [Dehalococcoidia bacterium]|nr:metalloregulator ArsR/SmtB family transcription factor [Dehalococcoidia bacterium]